MGLFDEQISLKPDNYAWTGDFIKSAWQSFWTPDEFNFSKDISDFHIYLSPEEREMVTRCLSAIGQIEVAVKTFWAKIGDTMPHPSISDLGYTLANQEVIHQRAYTKLLEILGLESVFEDNLKNPIINGRFNYLRKYNKRIYEDDRKHFVYKIALFTLFVENVSLFSQFFVILHLNRRNALLKDTAQQVNYTMLEEHLHSQVGIKIINTIRQEYPELFDEELEQRIASECKQSIDYEMKVIEWIVNGYTDDGLDSKILEAFICKRMIQCMNEINIPHDITYDKSYDDQIRWVDEMLLGTNLVDFFVKRPVDYSKNTLVSEDELF